MRTSLNKQSSCRVALLGALAGICCVSAGWADPALPGGETTVFDETRYAFSLPARNLKAAERTAFQVGNSFFNRAWVTAPASTTARDGLGPVFNARSCSACHFRDGRGQALNADGSIHDSLLFRLSVGGQDGADVPHPVYGGQLGQHAIPGARPEATPVVEYDLVKGKFADGTEYELSEPRYRFESPGFGALDNSVRFSPRVAPPVYGLGLLEALSEETIMAMADPDDADGDGISGRANRVWDIRKRAESLGRFGWKAGQPSVRQQSAAALVNDIGITSRFFPGEAVSEKQAREFASLPSGGEPEISDALLERISFYMHTIGVPARRDLDDPEVKRGEQLFTAAGCASCHTPKLQTAPRYHLPVLAGQTIYPYTDLLLHDMGESLADGRPEAQADGNEWRTPPLWGIGLTEAVNGHTRFLHDGRARNLEEAILWHGGESEKSREAYSALSAAERSALLRFVESL